jgi:hypothetical protein
MDIERRPDIFSSVAGYIARKSAPAEKRIAALEARVTKLDEALKSAERRLSRQGEQLPRLEDWRQARS